MLNKKNVWHYTILLFSILLSFLIIFLFENPIYHVFALWLVPIISIIITKFEVTHPLVWFSSSFALYSSAYSILFILGYTGIPGYSKENILLPLIALSSVLLIVGTKKISTPKFHEQKSFTIMGTKSSKQIMEVILIILLLTLLVCVAALYITPFDSKNDLLENRNVFFIIGVYSTRFLSFFCSFYILLFIEKDKKKTKIFIYASALLIICLSLFTGERDVMFRFFVILVMTLFILNKISKKTILSLIPIGAVYLIASRYFKYYFVRGEINSNLEEETFIYSFLTADFNAAGENLQVLLNNSWADSFHGFSIIFIDFISPFIPGGVFINIGNWFNETFYPNSYSRAFTMVGEGYVASGLLGIIAIFTILGVLIKYTYTKSFNNIYLLVIYIYSIPTIIFGFRSTLGSVFTGLTRIALFSIFIHLILFLIINNKNANNKNKER